MLTSFLKWFTFVFFVVQVIIITGANSGCGLEAARYPRPSFVPSGPALSDRKVYEPEIRALLGTAAPFCEVVALKLRAVPTTNPRATTE